MVMFLLAKNNYNLAASKLKDVAINHLFARSVIDHHLEGKVYVDDLSTPNSFYVLNPYGMSLLYGNVSHRFLNSQLKGYLLGTSGLRKSDEFLQIFPQELENRIDATLGKDLQIHDIESELNYPDHLVVKHKRVNFKFNRFKFEHFLSGVDIEKFEFIPIDKTLFDHIKGSVVPNKFWDCANDFCTYGVGLSLVYKINSLL